MNGLFSGRGREREPVEDEEVEAPDELSVEEEEALEAERREAEGRYFNASRSHSASIIAILPLLAIYEIGMMGFGGDLNAAAALVKTPISWLRRHPIEIVGVDVMLLLNAGAIVAAIFALWRLRRRGALHAGTFGGMFFESCVYALLLGPLALLAVTGRLGFSGFAPHVEGFASKVVISCGAGVYEELLFRFIVLGGLFYVAKAFGEFKPAAAGAAALLLSGVVFSVAHFISPGEAVAWQSFVYRLAAGTVLGLIFLWRGLGIAAWTHALYDVYVMCFAQW